ncbi:hypothetical protein M4578_03100 [Salipiger sp. P9]|uniref:hypothetical protein n=1 Tax=Salipiger pentaromativorans TaxID=2943193 RepID=UPI0021582A1F|nr:hypothetical protein [Salipiger pentaromativorans]MCR8546802.1 hypothetical protein [Salipiger pentaromativorans]
MTRFTLATVLCLAASPALAFHCPADMKKIDAALAAGTSLSDSELVQVRTLRATGETQHKAGDHAASVKTLADAMRLLGIK